MCRFLLFFLLLFPLTTLAQTTTYTLTGTVTRSDATPPNPDITGFLTHADAIASCSLLATLNPVPSSDGKNGNPYHSASGTQIQGFGSKGATIICSAFSVISTSQCDGNDQNQNFHFQGESEPNISESPSSICVSGCTANKVAGSNEYVVTEGNEASNFIATYAPSNSDCTTETFGTSSPQNGTDFKYDLSNDSVNIVKDTDQCATDSQGNETCVPLVEQNTASISGEDGRDLTVNPQGSNCGTINGEFGCIPTNGTGIATITDSNGDTFTLDEPKNPINNPVINKGSGDTDSPFSTTTNNSTNTTINNNTNVSGSGSGSGSTSGSGSGTGTGSTDTEGQIDNSGIIESNNEITDELKKITEPDDLVFENTPTADSTANGAWSKFQNVPIVNTVSNISLGFSGQSCQSTPVSFNILDQPVSADLSMCNIMNDAGQKIGLVMMLIYYLTATFLFLRA